MCHLYLSMLNVCCIYNYGKGMCVTCRNNMNSRLVHKFTQTHQCLVASTKNIN